MMEQLVEITAGILILFGLIGVCAAFGRSSSPEEVKQLLGEALSLLGGIGTSGRER